MTTPLPLERLRSSPTAWRFEGHHDAGDTPVDASFYVTRTPPGGGVELHVHPYSEVFFLESGRAEYLVGEERLAVSAGHVVVVPPDTPHRYENVGEEPLLQFSVHDVGTMVQRGPTTSHPNPPRS